MPTPHRRGRLRPRVAALAATAAALVAVALAAAPSALAHAILVSSTPDNASVVQTAPTQVVLAFSEGVETAFGAVRVYDAEAQRVDTGAILRPGPREVAIRLGGAGVLRDGTYTVTWRVISADSHPVHGAFTFSVGAPSGDGTGVAATVQGKGAPGSIEPLQDVFRAVGFGLILLVLGGVVALLAVVPGDAPARRALWLWVSWLSALLVPVALGAIVLQGAGAGGFGIGRALHGDVIATVLDTRFGKVWLAQAAAAAALAVLAQLAHRLRALLPVALGLGLWLAVSPGAAGHAQATSALSWALDALHVVAASAWIGGLAAVALALWATGAGERLALAARTVPRFSTLALGSVAVLVVAGAVNGWLQVRSWHLLWETRYGVLLLVKVGLVLGLVGLGALQRLRSVRSLAGGSGSAAAQAPGDDARALPRFARVAAVELAVAAGVVAVTALLVATPPARVAAAAGGPYAVSAPIGPLELNLTVDPGSTGVNELHTYLLLENGQPAKADEVVIKASLPSAGIGPLTFKGTVAGPGHFVFAGSELPLPGRWTLRVEARQGEFDLYTATVSAPIRKGS